MKTVTDTFQSITGHFRQRVILLAALCCASYDRQRHCCRRWHWGSQVTLSVGLSQAVLDQFNLPQLSLQPFRFAVNFSCKLKRESDNKQNETLAGAKSLSHWFLILLHDTPQSQNCTRACDTARGSNIKSSQLFAPLYISNVWVIL